MEQAGSDNPLDTADGEQNRPLPSNNFGSRFEGPQRGGFDGPEAHRGGFDDDRGGFGPRGGFDGPRFHGPPHRFNSPRGRGGFVNERFSSPVNNFSDGPGN